MNLGARATAGGTRTAAGERWRSMQDAARGQALRLGDPAWTASSDPYADMGELLTDWGEGVLGPRDRRPVKLGVVHRRPPGVVLTS